MLARGNSRARSNAVSMLGWRPRGTVPFSWPPATKIGTVPTKQPPRAIFVLRIGQSQSASEKRSRTGRDPRRKNRLLLSNTERPGAGRKRRSNLCPTNVLRRMGLLESCNVSGTRRVGKRGQAPWRQRFCLCHTNSCHGASPHFPRRASGTRRVPDTYYSHSIVAGGFELMS